MKYRFIYIVALALICLSASAQRSREEYKARYNLLTERLGATGVGIETLLSSWERDYPDDVDMLCGKFSYYFSKSQSVEVVRKDQSTFLGAKPVLSLKDSTGAPVNYFQETMYDDSLFAMSSSAIEKAIRLQPAEIDLRFNRITALVAYEKESPDMALSALLSLIDYYYTAAQKWTFRGEAVDNEFFKAAVQEYCYSFFRTQSVVSMEAFQIASLRMLNYNNGDAVFMNNIGSYWFVWKQNNRTAAKYYTSVLKKHPDDYTAAKNLALMYRREKNVSKEKKYLAILAKNSPDESERAAAEARLGALSKKK